MAVPREDYHLRPGWQDPSTLTSTVLDLATVSHDEAIGIGQLANPGEFLVVQRMRAG